MSVFHLFPFVGRVCRVTWLALCVVFSQADALWGQDVAAVTASLVVDFREART